MEILFIFIAIVAFFIVSLFIWNGFQKNKGNTEKLEEIQQAPEDSECCGQHAVCEKDSLINSFAEAPEYFDDEELDRYAGLPSDKYTDEIVEEFREILYSMYDEEKPRWIRSLQRRGIAVPDQLKDEIILIVNDLRSSK